MKLLSAPHGSALLTINIVRDGFSLFKPIPLTFAVKKLNTPDYRHYLKLWNQETKPKFESMKDLPKLNQVGLCLLRRFV